jgi:hypothetical protein
MSDLKSNQFYPKLEIIECTVHFSTFLTFSSKGNVLLCVRIAKSADPDYNGFLKKKKLKYAGATFRPKLK